MRITLSSGMAAVLLASAAFAAPADTPSEPALRVAQGNAASAPATTALTEAEARARIAAQGFGSISELSQDGMGLWHARAIKNGRRLNVVVDSGGRVQINTGRSG